MQRPLLTRILPFVFLGIGIVALIFSLMILAYLFIFGALVGLALFLVDWVKERFFPSKNMTVRRRARREGRTLDQDEFK